jgi:hypothetical protein
MVGMRLSKHSSRSMTSFGVLLTGDTIFDSSVNRQTKSQIIQIPYGPNYLFIDIIAVAEILVYK